MEPTTVCRDVYGMWVHPALQEVSPKWGEGTLPDQVESWFASQNLTHHLVFMDGELIERWFDGDLKCCAEWEPEPKIKDSFLVAIWDNDHGVMAMFASPLTHLEVAH